VQNALLCDKISLLFIIFTIKLKTDMMVRDGRYMGQKYLKLGPNLITPRSLLTLKISFGTYCVMPTDKNESTKLLVCGW
jgi:hypothetical protein